MGKGYGWLHGRRRRAAAVGTAVAVGAAIVVVATFGPSTRVGAQEDYPAPSDGVFTFAGHGFGHGHGMSQYGARGAALQGLTGTQILDFYYPGTVTTADSATSSIRVRLMAASSTSVPVEGASGLAVRDVATGTVYGLAPATSRYRITLDAGGMHVQSSANGGSSWTTLSLGGQTTLTGPLVFQGPPAIRLYFPDGTARDYEGTLAGIRTGDTTLATVNRLGLDKYVAGVVPREMPSYWPAAALRVQTVAARTYAVSSRSRAPSSQDWDICDTTACQVYGGRRLYSGGQVTDLQPASVLTAVAATAGQIRTYGGAPIFAQFGASNGGWTAANPAYPYLVARADPYDGVDDPYTNWTVSVSVADLAACFPSAGQVNRLSVVSRDGHGQWGGRIESVRLYGTSGGTAVQLDISGNQLRACKSAGGFRSTYATVTSAWTTSAAPAGLRSATGGLDVFARGPLGDLMYRRYVVGSGWQPWRSLGGSILGGPTVYLRPTGTLVVYARGADGQLSSGALRSGQWLGWTALGRLTTSRPWPVVASDGTLYVFFRGSDGALWYGRWTAAGTLLGWRSLGGSVVDGAGPAAAPTGGGGLTVVTALAPDGALATRSLVGGIWAPWQSIGGTATDDLAAVSPEAGVLDLYARTDAGTLAVRRAVNPAAGASAWGAWDDGGGGIAAGPWADLVEGAARTEAWVTGTDGAMYLRARAGGVWGRWQKLP